MTEKIARFQGKSFAGNENSEVFGELLDVNGFKFLNIKLVGPFKTHVYKGCKVVFQAEGKNFEVDSDSLEINTDYSRKLSIGITTFDIDLDGELEAAIRQNSVKAMEVIIDRSRLFYHITDAGALVSILENPVSDNAEIDESNVELNNGEIEIENHPEPPL